VSDPFAEPVDDLDAALARRPVLTAPQQVSVAIEDLILDGTLRPGDRLPTVEVLSRRVRVSAPTAHQALQALRDQSVLVVVRGRNGGYRVAADAVDAIGRVRGGAVLGRPAAPSAEHYEELLQVREVQDVLAARVAAARRTDDDLRELERLLPRPLGVLPDDLDHAFDLDLRFHRLVALSTHNPRIVAFTTATTLALRHFPRATDVRPADVVHALDAVLDAIALGDGEAAAEAMGRHLRRSGQYFGHM
jgi:DNA-binding FadR family transcriptional regulator